MTITELADGLPLRFPSCYCNCVRGKISREQFLAHPDIKDAAEHAAK